MTVSPFWISITYRYTHKQQQTVSVVPTKTTTRKRLSCVSNRYADITSRVADSKVPGSNSLCPLVNLITSLQPGLKWLPGTTVDESWCTIDSSFLYFAAGLSCGGIGVNRSNNQGITVQLKEHLRRCSKTITRTLVLLYITMNRRIEDRSI